MRVYLQQNVFDAALDRVRRVYDEFSEVLVNVSGGKDSTVVLHLALAVAQERGRLPLNVFWMDQEAEWQCVADYVKSIMYRPDVKPHWFQGPFRMSNATTTQADNWLHAWRDGDDWIRPKDPIAVHENITGEDRFHKLFGGFKRAYFGHTRLATLTGVRCEESPGRALGLTSYPKYKDITWGATEDKKLGHYTFHPLYDWTWRDVWKAIHSNGWPYCALYDYMYQRGVPVHNMRVSNVHHETALRSLDFLQEIEPDTWNRIVARVRGCNAVSQLHDGYRCPKELPWMFNSWREYRDHLLDRLIAPDKREAFRRKFAAVDRTFRVEEPEVDLAFTQAEIGAILVNDYEGVLVNNCIASHGFWMRNFGKKKDQFTGQRRPAA